MKRLTMAFVVGCTTFVLHAASFMWQSDTDLVDNTGVALRSTDYSFVLACIGDGSGVDYSSAYDNICNTGSFSWSDSYNEITGTYGLTSGKDMNGMIYAVLAQKDDTLFYLNNYGTEGLVNTYTLTGFDDPTSPINDFTFGAGDGFVIGEAVPTPEPTSGLLVLIGMAGLALKRKRA